MTFFENLLFIIISKKYQVFPIAIKSLRFSYSVPKIHTNKKSEPILISRMDSLLLKFNSYSGIRFRKTFCKAFLLTMAVYSIQPAQGCVQMELQELEADVPLR